MFFQKLFNFSRRPLWLHSPGVMTAMRGWIRLAQFLITRVWQQAHVRAHTHTAHTTLHTHTHWKHTTPHTHHTCKHTPHTHTHTTHTHYTHTVHIIPTHNTFTHYIHTPIPHTYTPHTDTHHMLLIDTLQTHHTTRATHMQPHTTHTHYTHTGHIIQTHSHTIYIHTHTTHIPHTQYKLHTHPTHTPHTPHTHYTQSKSAAVLLTPVAQHLPLPRCWNLLSCSLPRAFLLSVSWLPNCTEVKLLSYLVTKRSQAVQPGSATQSSCDFLSDSANTLLPLRVEVKKLRFTSYSGQQVRFVGPQTILHV